MCYDTKANLIGPVCENVRFKLSDGDVFGKFDVALHISFVGRAERPFLS